MVHPKAEALQQRIVSAIVSMDFLVKIARTEKFAQWATITSPAKMEVDLTMTQISVNVLVFVG